MHAKGRRREKQCQSTSADDDVTQPAPCKESPPASCKHAMSDALEEPQDCVPIEDVAGELAEEVVPVPCKRQETARPPEPQQELELAAPGEAPPRPSKAEDAKSRAVGATGHSRFRKDQVNLNKAVAKWLKQEAKGDMTHEEVAQRIRTSVAARHLRASRGAEFDEETFVLETLGRAPGVPEAPLLLERHVTPTMAGGGGVWRCGGSAPYSLYRICLQPDGWWGARIRGQAAL